MRLKGMRRGCEKHARQVVNIDKGVGVVVDCKAEDKHARQRKDMRVDDKRSKGTRRRCDKHARQVVKACL